MTSHRLFAAGVVVGCVAGGLATSRVIRGQGGAASPLEGSLSHISFAVTDAEKTAKAFGDVFGVPVPAPRVYRDIDWGPAYPGRKMHGKLVQLQINKVRFEIVEPLDGESPWKDHLTKSGEGVHHIGFGVKDVATLQTARDYLVSKGGRQTQAYSEGAIYIDMHGAGVPMTFEITAPSRPAPAPPAK